MRTSPLDAEDKDTNSETKETPKENGWLADVNEDEAQIHGIERHLFEGFSKIFLRRAEERYVRRLSPDQLRKGLANLLGFLSERAPGEIKIRTICPYDLGLDPNEDLVAIDTCMDDQVFIIDTLKFALSGMDLPIAHSMTMLLPTQRDGNGRLTSIAPDDPESRIESVTRFFVLRAKDPAIQQRIVEECHETLVMARAAVNAYLRLKKLCRELMNEYDYLSQIVPRDKENFQESAHYLGWLLEDNFVFFGAHFYEPKLRPEDSMGAAALIAPPDSLKDNDATRFFHSERIHGNDLIQTLRSQIDSRIHRPGKITRIKIRRFDDSGRPAGGVVLYGLLTRKAHSARSGTIPIVRRRLEKILQEEEAIPDSYHYRAIRNAFNALPVEFLLEAPPTDLKDLVVAAARAETAEESVVHVALDPERQSAFTFIILSQDVFTDHLRETLQALLMKGTKASYSDHRVSVGFGRSIGLYFYLTGCDLRGVDGDELEAKLLPLCTPWPEQLGFALRAAYDPEKAQLLQERYGEAFPETYQHTTTPDQAVQDIDLLERVLQSGEMRFDFFQETVDIPHKQIRLRIYHKGDLFLSEVLPILDHFGFRVIDEYGTRLRFHDGTRMSMDTFRIDADEEVSLFLEWRGRLVHGLRAVFRGDVPSDPLNHLMARIGLRWEEVDLLRAYLGYALQIRPSVAREAVYRALAHRTEATRALCDLFHARFAPEDTRNLDANSSRTKRMEQIREILRDRLRLIQDATEYRVLKIFENLIESTVRTNFYRRDRKSHYISFKFDCAKLEVVPEPRPQFEIFVHAATVEGVHQRGGRIARGGIRWSDRVDDYRTEVFGLMRTQMVKNVLIVPEGAKGGFILKNEKPGQDRRAFADKMYEVFIRGLLDVTDNIIDGNTLPPPSVICHDDPDPYLVVAADKGTAHLSDTANRVSQEYNFWLQDAFASGGSAGYDHKLYAITARGAWACVRHHFSFLDVDPETDPIRVVGIGDMSGDVFGNGMLLSSSMKLVGAFDHRHIFLDPDPDPQRSFEERKRLFETPRSSWTDYQKEVLSSGGGVFSRKEKEIHLSPECQQLLGVTATSLPPEDVIRKLLTLDIDLLWNGGIGTFIKASTEESTLVGDRVNDVIRVDANQVKAKVIGEGGNLGITWAGRVEYALNGGRINTDAIDNSGGVDLSDHEVNIKILLAPMVTQGILPLPERNKLLQDIADEVCTKVVEDNVSHAIMLTLDEIRTQRDPYVFVRAVRFLDENKMGLPPNETVPSARELQARGIKYGYLRPELSRISSYMKMYITKELLLADPLKFLDNERLLQKYFPHALLNRYQDSIERHLLIKELLVTLRTNELFQFAGLTFFPDLVVEANRSVVDVALAYTLAVDWFDAEGLRAKILHTPDVRANARYHALSAVEDGIREATSWLLHFLPGDTLWRRAQLLQKRGTRNAWASSKPKASQESDDETALQRLKEHLPKSASRAWRRVLLSTTEIQELGLPEEIAKEIGLTNQWAKAFPIAELSERTGRSLPEVARTYLTLGQKTRLNALILRIGRQPASDHWEALALRGLRASLLRILLEFAQKVLVARADPDEILGRYPAFLSLAKEINRAQPNPDAPVAISVLVVVSEKLRKAVDRVQLESHPRSELD